MNNLRWVIENVDSWERCEDKFILGVFLLENTIDHGKYKSYAKIMRNPSKNGVFDEAVYSSNCCFRLAGVAKPYGSSDILNPVTVVNRGSSADFIAPVNSQIFNNVFKIDDGEN